MKIISKKPAIDYFEQMLTAGRPLIKKNGRPISRAEVREQEVDDNLLKIYQDERGQTVDVHKFSVRQRQWWLRGLLFLIYGLVLVVFGWVGYNYYTGYRAKTDLLTINIETDKNLTVGNDFAYNISYRNNGLVALDNVEIRVTWPTGFIFNQAEPLPTTADNTWLIGNLPAKTEGKIIIQGRIINKIGENNQLAVNASFKPVNLSSTFVITKDYNIVLSVVSVAVDLSAPDTLAIGRNNELAIVYQAKAGNNLDNLQLVVNNPDWADFKLVNNDGQIVEPQVDRSWILPMPNDQINKLKLIIIPKAEASGLKTLSLRLETKLADRSYLVDSRDFDCQLIDSKLNLLFQVNNSNADSGVNAGKTLNYQINYANQGDSTIKDVSLVTVLQGDWLDWSSLKDKEKGQVSGQTIVWSKTELPELALLKPGAGGVINFSIKLKDWANGDKSDAGQIIGYAYYQLGPDTVTAPESQQKSNTIINQLNSDLSFREAVMYFNEDNMAVGSGPLPFVVGETTNLKVYWHLNNTLHDLRDVSVTVELPDYVVWAGKNNAPAGQINYNQDNHQVTWQLASLPASSQDIIGEFSIGITPRQDQQNQIITLLPGSQITAVDNATQSRLELSSQAKTSRLEDDQIAQTDGLVK